MGFCAFSNASALQGRMGECLDSMFKAWPDKSFVQGEKMLGVRVAQTVVTDETASYGRNWRRRVWCLNRCPGLRLWKHLGLSGCWLVTGR